jgi:hypothetical protein
MTFPAAVAARAPERVALESVVLLELVEARALSFPELRVPRSVKSTRAA